jgi:RNA polymerase sigma-70 factor (ECF subfamily)
VSSRRIARVTSPPPDARVHRLTRDQDVADEELVQRALAGDAWAKEALYRRHVHRVTAVAARLLRRRDEVEDVVQDTFACGFRELDRLREPARVGSWLVASAVHRIQKRFRRRRLQRLLGLDRSLDDETLVHQARSDASQEARVELARIDAALLRAGDAERTCWVLRHLFGYPLPEVAALTGCSLSTVNRRIARAQAIVEQAIGSNDDD